MNLRCCCSISLSRGRGAAAASLDASSRPARAAMGKGGLRGRCCHSSRCARAWVGAPAEVGSPIFSAGDGLGTPMLPSLTFSLSYPLSHRPPHPLLCLFYGGRGAAPPQGTEGTLHLQGMEGGRCLLLRANGAFQGMDESTLVSVSLSIQFHDCIYPCHH